MSPLSEWQVTLCDPIWHVSFRSGEVGCELLYFVHFILLHSIHEQSQGFYSGDYVVEPGEASGLKRQLFFLNIFLSYRIFL